MSVHRPFKCKKASRHLTMTRTASAAPKLAGEQLRRPALQFASWQPVTEPVPNGPALRSSHSQPLSWAGVGVAAAPETDDDGPSVLCRRSSRESGRQLRLKRQDSEFERGEPRRGRQNSEVEILRISGVPILAKWARSNIYCKKRFV